LLFACVVNLILEEFVMKRLLSSAGIFIIVAFFAVSVTTTGTAHAAEAKIGVINMKRVLAGSVAGKKAQKVLEKKMNELRAKFKKDEASLLALQKEIEKKSSAWSTQVKQQKAIEFQKKRRDLGAKQDDANLELKQLREKYLTPILKKLEQVVKEQAKKGGYTIVLPNTAVLYRDKGADMTALITNALNKAMKK